jgi:hypothetical protein
VHCPRPLRLKPEARRPVQEPRIMRESNPGVNGKR